MNRSLLRPKIQSLLRIRGNHLLDQIRHSDSTHQVHRIARLVGDIAAITSTLTMTLCDIIFKFCSNHSERQVRARHSLTLEAIINDVCAQPLVLQERGFLEEHCKVTARQLGFFTGFASLHHCQPDPASLREALQKPEHIDPF